MSTPVSSLAPGGRAEFSVIFTPGASGTRTANLHLASNDADEASFDITLTGSGRLSSNANLSGIALAGLSPAFSPAKTNYTASVPFFTSSLSLAVSTERPVAALTFNGIAANGDGTSQPIALKVGSNVINITATAQDGTTRKTYTVTIERLAANPGAPDSSFLASVDSDVYTTTVLPDGRLIIAGDFTTVGLEAIPYLARLSAQGQVDAGFAPVPDGRVNACSSSRMANSSSAARSP